MLVDARPPASCSACSPPSATCACPELRKLDRFAALILDDIGYVQQNRDEMEVLFTLLAERYERNSVVLTTQSGLLRVGPHLQGPHDHGGRHRPRRAPLGHPRPQSIDSYRAQEAQQHRPLPPTNSPENSPEKVVVVTGKVS